MQLAEDVVVATDAGVIVEVIEGAGGRAVLTAPTHASGTDRVAEVSALPAFRRHGVLLNVQGDEPFVATVAAAGALSMVIERGFPLGTAASPAGASILAEPNVVKVVTADDGRALYFSRAPIPFLRDASDPVAVARRDTMVRQHVGVYAYTREALAAWVALPEHPLERIERLEQLRPLGAGLAMGVAVIDVPPLGGVDTEDDLARANARWADLFAGRS